MGPMMAKESVKRRLGSEEGISFTLSLAIIGPTRGRDAAQEPAKEPADGRSIMLNLGLGQHGAFDALPAGVPDAAGGAANQSHHAVPAARVPREREHPEKVAQVEAIGGGVEAAVHREGPP